jgi:hypothetical protein
LQALLAGSITDDLSAPSPALDAATAKAIAAKLVARTTSTGPLRNRAELVGRWTGTGSSPATSVDADPDAGFSGFSLEVGSAEGIKGTDAAFITARREAALRALADAGTTRVWNLMIDLVAQTGRFPKSGDSLDAFQVTGERRFWLHVAIDRLTGEVLDQQLEVVTE